MAKVLVANHERAIRRALRDLLGKNQHEVLEAANGQATLETVSQEDVDLILLAATMPGMDGWEVLTRLRESRRTETTPVILLTSVASADAEVAGMRLGVSHIISKPYHPETLMTVVRLALREGQRTVREERPAPAVEEDPPYIPKTPSGSRNVIGTGGEFTALDRALGGGIPLKSLTLVEGASRTGKSVICQFLSYGAILDGRNVGYFLANQTADGLIQQMTSIGLDMSDYLREDKLSIYPMQKPAPDDDPRTLLAELVSDVQRAPAADGLIVVDNVSGLAVINEDRAVLGFFASCQRLCSEGSTMVVVADSSAFDRNMISRIHGICNTHISIFAESIRQKFVTTIEVTKANNVERRSDNRFTFEVEPDGGIRIIPVSRVKA